MFNIIYNRLKSLYSWKVILKYISYFIGVLLTALYFVFLYDVSQGCFPILHKTMEWGVPLGNFSGSQLIASSIVWYAILLGIFITTPLFIGKFFENKQIYQYYKIFWLITSLLFALLTARFYHQGNGIIFFEAFIFVMTLFLTLTPAIYQNKMKKHDTEAESLN